MDWIGLATVGIGGFTVGTLVGLALRFISKIILYTLGLYLASLVFLSGLGLVVVNWAGIEEGLTKLINWIISVSQVDLFTGTGIFGTSTVIGLLFGLTRKATIHNTDSGNYRFYRRI